MGRLFEKSVLRSRKQPRSIEASSSLPSVAAVGLCCLTTLFAGCTTAPKTTTSSLAPVTTAYEDAKFVPAIPGQFDGPRIAVLWGDPTAGPSAMLFDLPKLSLPLHYHTADYHLVVIEGKLKHWIEGESEASAKTLGPGSYWFQPGGKVHGDACLSERCLVHLVWTGPRDAHLPPKR
jgi:mannose-6-phosphate isomerase-like protein (cupin superfamily)